MTPTKPKQPISYSGTGSAIDNYLRSQNIDAPPEEKKEENWAIFDKNNPKHKIVLSLLYQMQWVVPSKKWGEVPDLDRLSKFLQSEKSPVKKKLKDMETHEVEKLIVALRGIVKHRYK